MYFPYLRGKMYEMLAVRELIERNIIQKKYISPIIEPVRDNSTFNSLVKEANRAGYSLNIISNPQVGEYKENDKLNKIIKNNNMVHSVIITDKDKSVPKFSKKDLLFYSSPIKVLNDNNKDTNINVVPDNTVFRTRIGDPKPQVIFADCFNKQKRNSDYLKIPDESFSEYHLIYSELKYKGFGDYSIIGEEYTDSGFAPYAVAIHIVYFAKGDSLRIRHFVSDSNDDMYDPANKLNEALKKLHSWYKSNKFNKDKNDSEGLRELDQLYMQDKYPGLGYLKKLEIMHHLEIMNRFLSRKG